MQNIRIYQIQATYELLHIITLRIQIKTQVRKIILCIIRFLNVLVLLDDVMNTHKNDLSTSFFPSYRPNEIRQCKTTL